MVIQQSSPDSMVCAAAGVEITKDNRLILLRHSRQEDVKVPIEFIPCRRRDGNRETVIGCKLTSPERHSSNHVFPDGKDDTCFPSLCLGATGPEGVAGTHLLQLALFGEKGLAGRNDFHLVARQFLSC
nr:unnamed protein product [Spirometra erinaceieuropaei]